MNKPQEDNKEQKRREQKLPYYFYNWISYVGAFLASFIFILEVVFFAVDIFGQEHNVYLGIITYTILPIFLILGLLLIPIGALRKRNRLLKGLDVAFRKKILFDLTSKSHRNAMMIFFVGTCILVIMTAIGSYKAFHYTESVHFCGQMCHVVMDPQYTTYINSPHANVKCVECHIGSGADWYVRSKLSGTRQVFKTIGNTFPRPIPTPVHNLRPAKETCEECHWPGKFYSSFELNKTYYSTYGNDEYPPWQMRMLIKVGGGEGKSRGIHAHMYAEQDIYYAAEDERLQEITWVRTVDKKGKEEIYTSPDSKFKETPPTEDEIRKMDCIDCHNQPTHHMYPPNELVNNAIYFEKIDGDLPAIKEKAMEVLSDDYATKEEGKQAIREELTKHFKEELGGEYGSKKEAVEQAIETIIKLYHNNFFPEMKTNWEVYPNNIGHLIFPGCFRCHTDEHKTSSGKVITKDCDSCHVIIEQGPVGAVDKSTDGLDFVHPFEDDGYWMELDCTECHTGN